MIAAIDLTKRIAYLYLVHVVHSINLPATRMISVFQEVTIAIWNVIVWMAAMKLVAVSTD